MLHVTREVAKVDRADAFLGSVLEGRPFVYRATTASNRTLKFTNEVVEQNILIDALSPFGLIPDGIDSTNLRPAQRDEISRRSGKQSRRAAPDFELRFGNRTVYCECKLAEGSMGSADLAIADWGYNLSRYAYEHLDLDGLIGNHYVALVPSRAPRQDEIPALVDEAVQFIQNEPIETYTGTYGTRVGTSYRRMAELDTVIAVGNSSMPQVFVQAPARSTGGPREALNAIAHAFSSAVEQGYHGFRPLWLLIGASSLPWKTADAVGGFVSDRTGIEPFERVFIANSNESFMIVNDTAPAHASGE